MEICNEVNIMGLTVQDKEKSDEMKDGGAVTERSAELERKLRTRADREHLVQKNILPDLSTSPILYTQTQQLQRAKNADNLQKKLRNRPERQDLMHLNILPDLQVNIDPGLQSKQMQLKKSKLADALNRKLASRPGPLELIQGRILEPKNAALAEMVRTVFENTTDGEKNDALSSQDTSPVSADKTGPPSVSRFPSTSCMSPQVEHSPSASSKDLTSPFAEVDRAGVRKFSDSSSPAHSPGDTGEEMSSPTKGLMSPPSQFAQSYPPAFSGAMRGNHLSNLGSSGGKSPSLSQRKKQQKQKYRKLRYHEYVPPSKSNGKGGKTNPKPSSKPESPYNQLLQQQQLFLQLQVLQQQYPNGVLMQKLPDIVDSLSKSGKGKGKATSPSGTGAAGTTAAGGATAVPTMNVPQIVPVESPHTSIRFEELKVSDLKAACKEMGMIVSGKKAELVERLLDHNNGVLPAFALPESHAKDALRSHQQYGRPMRSMLLETQSSAPNLSSPSSPIFKFPEDQSRIRGQPDASGVNSAGRNVRKSSLPSLPMGAPQVIPASSLQQQFNELVERQKRSYICQGQAPKSLAPRPELGDMVAIKFPRPIDTQLREQQSQQQQQPNKGLSLPRAGSDSKMVMSPFSNQHSHSLPSSPKPLSPANSTSHLLGELMEQSAAESQGLEASLQMPCSSGNITGPTTSSSLAGVRMTSAANSQTFHSSTQPSSSVTTNSTGAPRSGSFAHAAPHTPLMTTTNFYQPSKQPLRPSHSIPHGGILSSKLHPPNPPPPYGSVSPGLMHRSLSSPYSHNMAHRVHSGASFGSDSSDLITPPDLHKHSMEGFMFHEDLGGQHGNPLDIPMDTQMDTTESSHLSEIFSILEGDSTGFGVPGHPPSYPNKVAGHQVSLRSDSIMLGSGLSYHAPNTTLAHQHKSNQDIALLDGHKHTVNPPPYNCSGAMLGSGMSWLDQPDSIGGGGGLLNEVSPVGPLIMNHSNPGSLPHEGFQMNFLDDLGMHKPMVSSAASMNGFSHGETFLTHSLPTSSGLLFSVPDESQALLELGLSTS